MDEVWWSGQRDSYPCRLGADVIQSTLTFILEWDARPTSRDQGSTNKQTLLVLVESGVTTWGSMVIGLSQIKQHYVLFGSWWPWPCCRNLSLSAHWQMVNSLSVRGRAMILRRICCCLFVQGCSSLFIAFQDRASLYIFIA